MELRILIYNELIPDEYIRSYFASGITPGYLRNQSYFPLLDSFIPLGLSRKDGDACYPVILRLNWQIYYEVIPMWYETGKYHLWVSNQVNFLGQETLISESVPNMLKFVISLRIYVHIRHVNISPTSDVYRYNNHAFLNALGDYLASSGTLKQLRIDFAINTPTWLAALEGSSIQ